MANKLLFQSTRGRQTPAADTRNLAGGVAYLMPPEHELAQHAATGCLRSTFYASADSQLYRVLSLCGRVPPEFVAKTALYCRAEGRMKDLPALLCAALSVLAPGLMAEIFDRVIDSPRMLRNFVQILRSGVVARKSLGTLPKRLVREWFDARSDEAIFTASVGNSPSIADIVRMVHPKPATKSREALYGYLLGRAHDGAALPEIVRGFEAYKAAVLDGRDPGPAPDVPFQMLTALPLGAGAWEEIALRGSWQTTRMNLNTYARHGALADDRVASAIASKLADSAEIERARVLPYQILTAWKAASRDVPRDIHRALEAALRLSLRNVPTIEGKAFVFVDVSRSMHAPITGYQKGASSAVRCVDVAALVAAAVLARNQDAEVIAFSDAVVPCRLNPRDTVMTNAERLSGLPSGGTNCSAPLAELNRRSESGDTVIYVSDSESWIDTRPGSWRRGAETMVQWEAFRARSPQAKLVCIDLQPNSTTQAPDRPDILNVGGFSDAVFKVIDQFSRAGLHAQHWVDVIDGVCI